MGICIPESGWQGMLISSDGLLKSLRLYKDNPGDISWHVGRQGSERGLTRQLLVANPSPFWWELRFSAPQRQTKHVTPQSRPEGERDCKTSGLASRWVKIGFLSFSVTVTNTDVPVGRTWSGKSSAGALCWHECRDETDEWRKQSPWAMQRFTAGYKSAGWSLEPFMLRTSPTNYIY